MLKRRFNSSLAMTLCLMLLFSLLGPFTARANDDMPLQPVDDTKSNTSIEGFDTFISRQGDKLMDGEKEFRFISMNGSNLTYIPNPSWQRVDAWEQEDVFKSLVQIGGTVVRLYPFTIKGGIANKDQPSHINGLRDYGEDFFRDLDKVLEFANKYQIRVIIPFIDTWDHVGGVKQFAAFRGKTQAQFYADPELKEDFQHLVAYTLNRTNTYTGVQYKDDKAILAWETGNELYPTDDWTHEMSAYIKSLDANHLVMDGSYGIKLATLDDPNVDIVSNHYYEGTGSNYAQRSAIDRNTTIGKKPFIIGEFGESNPANYKSLLDEVIANGTSGALLWTLKFHNRDGGFYNKGTDYRWPGFPSGNGYNETAVMNLMRDKAHEIQGKALEAINLDAPILLPIESVLSISWKGSAGAKTYDIQRAETPNGPWSVIGADVSDSDIPYKPFKDSTAVNGTVYYYRMVAKNGDAVSAPSNIIGPVLASTIPPVPAAPIIVPFQTVTSISWMPSQWAVTYEVERATNPDGPWTVVGKGLLERDRPYTDRTAQGGVPYYYRVKANNAGGSSLPSAIVGPIIVHNLAQLAQITVDSVNGTNVAANAVDGSLERRWLSLGGSNEHFIQFNWANPQTINEFKLWSGAMSGEKWHIRDFMIEYLDGNDWKTLTTVVDNDKDGFRGEFNHLIIEPVVTSSIRIRITKPSWGGIPVNPNDQIARLMEFEAIYVPPIDSIDEIIKSGIQEIDVAIETTERMKGKEAAVKTIIEQALKQVYEVKIDTRDVATDQQQVKVQVCDEAVEASIKNIDRVTAALESYAKTKGVTASVTKQLLITIPSIEAEQRFIAVFQASMLKAASEQGIDQVFFNSRAATMDFAPDMLDYRLRHEGSEIELSMETVDLSNLGSEDAEVSLDSRPIYKFRITEDGETINKFNGNKSVWITVDYELRPGERPNQATVYLLTDHGRLTKVRNGKYENAKLTFSLGKFD
ncbi:discoidin domain-containing protein [Paenibacillus sp. KQZ6P-2]|uniref:mannan endo-1,4-beta-mannosidase n=1 Tax=Paenibacillus mangrovi TaxID=2931978 RepID=A0A9X2B3J3_9BACL|nr:discoidin domain-containing protein [Paenibacillus mangrovi]MCJ8013486.1 discoidin domain-containing protein [Paenibacillus mangrovi]